MAGLSDLKARAIKPGETLSDGTIDGLFLKAGARGGRGKWVMRYTSPVTRKRRFMGFGSFPEVGIASVRKAAFEARALIASGVDPIDAKREEEAPVAEVRTVPTFAEVAAEVIADQQRKTANAKVAYQWEYLLGPAYCSKLRKRPVDEITSHDVKAVLLPLLETKPETARKLHRKIHKVGEYARIRLRDQFGRMTPNFADWSDLKAIGLESPRQLSQGHFASLDYRRMPEFMAALRERDAIAARMAEFLILTNVRTGSALEATWDQIDLENAVWSVPVANLKDKRHRREAFRIPLATRAVEILREAALLRHSEIVFPSRDGHPHSSMAMLTLLKRMRSGNEQWLAPDGRQITIHGFRATFKTWAEEAVTFPHGVIEEAMGHQVGTAVERAYMRSDRLEHRRRLMDAWAVHCEPTGGENVIAFRKVTEGAAS